ncbi:hypothetical protein SAMN05443575_0955 [Jatrophihabitans endophyticus]|uniref:Uncharacterized protein n=1 Tax=Jatrophihabitans endophyticus TaxID=1206085 RepID=A0A1M5EP88_9ACTN|nr:hypothetical protein [Jatrophihabitans endophyticus]SHF81007.1 hypothetical protein SAMN05443575_0955 [Jatrophihabitans endophyticus]
MAWVWWLSGPVVATVLAACWSWLRSRPRPERTTAQAVRDHQDYLAALAQPPRSQDRGTGAAGGRGAGEGTGD